MDDDLKNIEEMISDAKKVGYDVPTAIWLYGRSVAGGNTSNQAVEDVRLEVGI